MLRTRIACRTLSYFVNFRTHWYVYALKIRTGTAYLLMVLLFVVFWALDSRTAGIYVEIEKRVEQRVFGSLATCMVYILPVFEVSIGPPSTEHNPHGVSYVSSPGYNMPGRQKQAVRLCALLMRAAQ